MVKKANYIVINIERLNVLMPLQETENSVMILLKNFRPYPGMNRKPIDEVILNTLENSGKWLNGDIMG